MTSGREPDGFVDGFVDDRADGQGEARERRTTGRGGRRRPGGAPTVSTISWRDIPAQLTARAGGEQHKVLLHARFQHAIDRAAEVAGLTSTNDYVQQWRSVSSPLGASGGDPDVDVAAELDRLCADLEARYPRERLESLVANGGLDPATDDAADRPADHHVDRPTTDQPAHQPADPPSTDQPEESP